MSAARRGKREPFAVTHGLLLKPLTQPVLRHNAYVCGWEDGAVDVYDNDTIPAALRPDYSQGYKDGTAARGRGFREARKRAGMAPDSTAE
jgi:hypothetical protein